MPRKANTGQRRAQIVQALASVMAQVGYEKATIQAIAGQAGLAPGLIHYHFRNKQEILVSLVQSIADYARERFAGIAEQAGSPDERLRAYLHARLDLGPGADPERARAWTMVGAEAVRQPEVQAVYQEAVAAELDGLAALLRACLQARGRGGRSARDLAAGLMAFMEGAFQLSVSAAAVMPRGYAARTAWRFAAQGLEAEPRRP